MSKRDANDVLRDEGPDALRALYDEATADGSYQSQICADEMADKGTEPHEDDLRPPACVSACNFDPCGGVVGVQF